ncbi:MAG: ABC transporter transmembrane domain-containing protein [bacterium]|nr:ABC transporter transmembrane domain-containing protein [bacterium]
MARHRGGVLEKEDKRKLNKENFRKLYSIFSYILPHKWTFLLGLVVLAISSTMLMAFPFLSGKIVDVATGESFYFIDSVNTVAIILISILVAQSLFSFLRVYLFARVSEQSMGDLRYDLYQKMISLPFAFFDKNRTGELMSRVSNDVSTLQGTFTTTLAELIRQIITLVVGIVMILVLAQKLTLFMLATFPVVILAAMFFGRRIRKLSKATQDELAKTNVIVEETLQSISSVKSFTSELFELARYKKTLNNSIDLAIKGSIYRGAFFSFIILALFGSIVAIMWYGANLVQSEDMMPGELVSFVLITIFIGGSIAGLGDLIGQVQKAIGSSERILEILGEDSEQEISELKELTPVKGDIHYKNVEFSYPTRTDVTVLKNLSLRIEAGKKIALVGHSGAGKSTIAQLLMKFYTPQEGHIAIDGKNINDFELQALRQNIGIVPQEVILFGGTIMENISYGKPTASVEEIREAARKANALQFIEEFPEGLDTVVGERGVKLSGGQRQRIAIARAILKDPSILILDEATSSLDAESEHLVQQALETLMLGRTTIIIAHRLATIRQVDTIFVLKSGEIVESGSHEELLAYENGVYSNLVRLQLEPTENSY